MVLRVKFSASHYFEDCRRHKVTIAQYIGELARYLLHVPEVCNFLLIWIDLGHLLHISHVKYSTSSPLSIICIVKQAMRSLNFFRSPESFTWPFTDCGCLSGFSEMWNVFNFIFEGNLGDNSDSTILIQFDYQVNLVATAQWNILGYKTYII